MYQLTELEKEKIIAFNSDEAMVEAVRKVLLANIYANGTLRQGVKADPMVNAALATPMAILRGQLNMTNEELGRDLLAFTNALNTVEKAFMELSKIKKEVVVVDNTENEAI